MVVGLQKILGNVVTRKKGKLDFQIFPFHAQCTMNNAHEHCSGYSHMVTFLIKLMKRRDILLLRKSRDILRAAAGILGQGRPD